MAQAISDSYEYTVNKKLEGTLLLRKILFLSLYVLYVIVILTIALLTRLAAPAIAFIPITLWIIVYLTYPYCNIEYEYSMIDGNITFSTIYGSRKRKENFSMRISSFEKTAPYNDNYKKLVEQYSPEKVYIALSSEKTPNDPYFALFKDKNGKKCVFYFEATNRAVRIIKYYNENTVMTTLKI